MRLPAVGALLCASMLVIPVASSGDLRAYSVTRVVDGDTIVVDGGRRVRLVQIDAPELAGSECYAAAAKNTLAKLLPRRARVRLEFDPKLDRVDRYGRLLAYVRKGRENVNVTLVARGAASVWFYERVRGRHASPLLRAAKSARGAKRGLWKACPGTRFDPLRAVDTGRASGGSQDGTGRCDPSYPDVCIPSPPPDLDCADIRKKVRVLPPDPHRLDGDGDGWGCESYG
ncbi:MAG: thermonuclease family protein [Gaiellaceae bacterium]